MWEPKGKPVGTGSLWNTPYYVGTLMIWSGLERLHRGPIRRRCWKVRAPQTEISWDTSFLFKSPPIPPWFLAFFIFSSLSAMNSSPNRDTVQYHNGAHLTDESIQQLLAQAERRLRKNTETVNDSITAHQSEQSIPKYVLYSHWWWNWLSWLPGTNIFAL